MKRILIAACVALTPITAFAAPQNSQESPGIGIILGEPTGLSFRYRNFPILGLAWSVPNDSFHIHADYWVYRTALVPKPKIDWYIGGGLKYLHRRHGDDHPGRGDDRERHSWFGIRVPVGAQFFPDPRVEIFLELVPGIYLYPETDLLLDAGIGARFYFF